MPRDGDDDLRWSRIGYFDQERPVDSLIDMAEEMIPAEYMPMRWSAESRQDFINQFGEGVKWAATASYHLLLFSGTPIVRLWSNAKTVMQVEFTVGLKSELELAEFEVERIPEGSRKKRREFEWRTRISTKEELVYILQLVKVLYGVDD